MATNGMTINGLNPLSALTADDKIPVWDTGASGEPTKEITAQNMANSVKSLASLPNTTEMNAAIAQSTAVASFGIAKGAKISAILSSSKRLGKLCVLSGYLTLGAKLELDDVVATLSDVTATDKRARFMFYKNDASGALFVGKMNDNNQIIVDGGYANTASGQYYLFNLTFIAD